MKLVAALALALSSVLVAVSGNVFIDNMVEEFEAHAAKYGLVWTPMESLERLVIYAKNVAMIEAHNSNASNTYKMKMNQFGHLTGEEFKAAYTGFSNSEKNMLKTGGLRMKHSVVTPFAWKGRKTELPKEIDWVKKGAVTAVKNQGTCGSCWSFSTTGALEGAYAISHGELVALSEQNLVSCDTSDNACSGGLMDNAFKWVQDNGGLCKESDYPYVSGDKEVPSCKTSCKIVSGSAPSKYTDVDSTETALMKAVSGQPVSVAIEADQSAFQFYSSGVMTGSCGTSLDHGVLVVGYGEEDGHSYWKVKNSWGASWGVDGYIKLERGKDQEGGQCGILNSASFPTIPATL